MANEEQQPPQMPSRYGEEPKPQAEVNVKISLLEMDIIMKIRSLPSFGTVTIQKQYGEVVRLTFEDSLKVENGRLKNRQ